jgi:hypothetical protein
VPVAEGCFVTKCVKYTHQLVHWINDVRSGEDQDDQDLVRRCLWDNGVRNS